MKTCSMLVNSKIMACEMIITKVILVDDRMMHAQCTTCIYADTNLDDFEF